MKAAVYLAIGEEVSDARIQRKVASMLHNWGWHNAEVTIKRDPRFDAMNHPSLIVLDGGTIEA